MLDAMGMPLDWDDAPAWQRYWAAVADKPCWYFPGSIGAEWLAELITELRHTGRTFVWFPGCGASPLPRVMSMFGLNVHATDISESAVVFQQNRSTNKQIKHLKRRIRKAVTRSRAGSFVAGVHDFRTTYIPAAFDLVINERAFQGFERPSMDRIAASHCGALKPGGRAIFDTSNVQGVARDQLEESLVTAGFYVPLFEANRRLRRDLAATGIPYLFILGRPMIPSKGVYRDEEKRQADTAVLQRIFADHESTFEGEYKREQQQLGKDAKVAIIIYSTG